jgi:HAD superfamily hydrolase (TIGR01490 family)
LINPLNSKKKALLCFDLDGTLYPGNTSMAFYKYMLKIKAISKGTWPLAFVAYFCYRFSCKNITFLHKFVYKWILSKVKAQKILKLVPEFIKHVVVPNLRQKLIDQIKSAEEQGHRIALLSSSPDFIVNEIASFLNIHLTLASTYPVNTSGHFCSKIGVIRGENKALWIDSFLDSNPSFNRVIAYSDAMEDLPMLLKADIKYAVYPESTLLHLSLKNGWQLILS